MADSYNQSLQKNSYEIASQLSSGEPVSKKLDYSISQGLGNIKKQNLSAQISERKNDVKFPVGKRQYSDFYKKQIAPDTNMRFSKLDFVEKRDALSQQIHQVIPNPHLYKIVTQENVSKELSSLWQYIDLDQFPLENEEEKEAFKTHAIAALQKINSFLYQAQNSSDWNRKKKAEYWNTLTYDIEDNIQNIWEDNMNGLFNGEKISLEDFGDAFIFSQYKHLEKKYSDAFYSENNGYETDQYKEFIEEGKTKEDWDRERENFLKTNTENDAKKEKIGHENMEVFQKMISVTQLSHSSVLGDYVNAQAEFILSETRSGGHFAYLVDGTMNDDFVEVIRFLQGDPKYSTISPDAYRAMMGLVSDGERQKNREEWVNKKIKKVTKKYNKSEKTDVKDDYLYVGVQSKIANSDHLYQLGMQKLAKNALRKMGRNKESFIKFNESDGQEEKDAFFENIKNGIGIKDGYIVKNKYTDLANSSSDAQFSGRLTPQYFIMDKLIGTGGMIVAVANFLIAFRTGQWAASAPYIAGGLGVNYAMYNGFFNEGFSKMMNPERMLGSIVKESFGNKNYPAYFGNPWELALTKAIKWPGEDGAKGMKKELRGIEKKQEIETVSYVDDNGKVIREKRIGFMDRGLRKEANFISQNISVDHFRGGKGDGKNNKSSGVLAKYLPQTHILGPNGKMYRKERFLDLVQEHESVSNMNGHIRFEMMNKIAGRVGDKDSFLPLLDQLHQHYLPPQNLNHGVENNLKKFKNKMIG